MVDESGISIDQRVRSTVIAIAVVRRGDSHPMRCFQLASGDRFIISAMKPPSYARREMRDRRLIA